jgi:hypothetical protein
MRVAWLLSVLLLVPLLSPCPFAQAQPIESFYRGKTIQIKAMYPN